MKLRIQKPVNTTVLIVEDNPLVSTFYTSALSDIDGVNLAVACDGVEGLQKAGKLRPEVIVTDLDMPKLNGFKMVRILRNDHVHNKVRIVVVSALKEEEISRNGGLPDDVLFIRKGDVTIARLRAMVVYHLKHKRVAHATNNALRV